MIRIADGDDFDYVKQVLLDDEMWARISDDYSIKCESSILSINCIWLVCTKGDKRVGVSSIHHGGNSAVDIHIYIPKENRGGNTKKIGLEILSWVKCNSIEEIHKVNTKIPTIYKDVIMFAKSLGFKVEGVDSKSIMKNGMLLDKVCLGISTELIEEF